MLLASVFSVGVVVMPWYQSSHVLVAAIVPPDIVTVPHEMPPPVGPRGRNMSVPLLMLTALTHAPLTNPKLQPLLALTVAPLLIVKAPRMTPAPPAPPKDSVPPLTVVPPR